jgi:hypothetical protein
VRLSSKSETCGRGASALARRVPFRGGRNARPRHCNSVALFSVVLVLLLTPEEGAEPLLHLATITDPRTANGAYFDRLDGPMAVR